jgi:hypothetical protein
MLPNFITLLVPWLSEFSLHETAVSFIKHVNRADFNVQSDGKTMQLVLDLLKMLMPSIIDNYQQTSAVGSLIRAQQALKSLKNLLKTVEPTEQLMV